MTNTETDVVPEGNGGALQKGLNTAELQEHPVGT